MIRFALAFASLVIVACTPPPPTGPTTPQPIATTAAPTAPATAPEVTPSSDPRLAELYTCWFKEPYQYMFAGNDHVNGQFEAGTRGILFYGNLTECMDTIEGRDARGNFADLGPIARFAKLEVSVTPGAFPGYSKELIKWGHENLIPDPSTDVGDGTAQERYDRQFVRFFRLLAETYVILERTGFGAEQDLYKQAVAGGQDGITYLTARYDGKLPSYKVQSNGSPLTVPMAFGFWLRRGVDDTADELWIGLTKVMGLYDVEFHGKLAARHKDTGLF